MTAAEMMREKKAANSRKSYRRGALGEPKDPRGLKHGGFGTPEYHAYHAAKSRCTNPKHPKWPHYGARGIEFRFTNFEQFLAEVGPKPKGYILDREDNEGHYEPGNLRWVTVSESLRNRRANKIVASTAPAVL